MLFPQEVIAQSNSRFLKNKNIIQNKHPDFNKIICLSNQFYLIIEFPSLTISYSSINIKDVLGFEQNELSFIDFINLIHPDDYNNVFFNIKRSLQIARNNRHSLYPFKCFMILNYRIRNKQNSTIRILNQLCYLDSRFSLEKFNILCLITDLSICKKTKLSSLKNLLFNPEEHKLSSLSQREQEVLSLLTKGKNSVEIGKILNISKHTVDTHRRNMLIKSEFNNTAELIAYSFAQQLKL
ncbi:hypothetical protein E9993_04455 [Labilibacter sediminis]|nr:hypothetical protein E9993_04455 [Labilibacter sediminis]